MMIATKQDPKFAAMQIEVWSQLEKMGLEKVSGECPHCSGQGMISPNVGPTHPAFGKSFVCICKRQTTQQKRRWGGTGIPRRLAECSFDLFDGLPEDVRAPKLEARRLAGDMAAMKPMLVDGHMRNSLFLCGSFGVGKSGLASCIAQAWTKTGKSVLWMDANEFIEAILAVYDAREIEQRLDYTVTDIVTEARTADLLVIDDFGDVDDSKPMSKHTRDKFFAVLRHRHYDLLPVVTTSNLNLSEVYDQAGGRIYERIAEMCHIVNMGGQSFRTGVTR